jgi:hypothetical protein
MKLSNKQYDILKWIISIVLPASIVFMGVVFNTIGWQHSEAFLTIAVALEVFLGTIFKISDYNYHKGEK